MVSSEAISEIRRLVDHHLAVAGKLQEAVDLLSGASSQHLPLISTSAPTNLAVTQSSLVPVTGNLFAPAEREARIDALNGVEFTGMRYNDVVATALDVWGPAKPRPRRADIIKIMFKGGFDHKLGESGAKISIRNAAASGKNGSGPVIKLPPTNDVDGEYALRTWFGAPSSNFRKKNPPKQKEMSGSDLIPEEQVEPTTQNDDHPI